MTILAPDKSRGITGDDMRLGMIGLGRMGSNMVERLMADGHDCVVFDRDTVAVEKIAAKGARGSTSLEGFVSALDTPRAIWIMLPETVVDQVIEQLTALLAPGDTVIDGGNSYFQTDLRRADNLASHRLNYVDVGTSGGVWGRDRGYCLMIGGDSKVVTHLEPIFQSLSPDRNSVSLTHGRPENAGTADQGYLHCGGPGAGHFVKMVHNGIEYGLMAAYAEGFALIDRAGKDGTPASDDRVSSELTLNADASEIAELWRRGSVVGSWLLDLSAESLHADPGLQRYGGEVSDSGEGRWFIKTATDLGIPVHVLAAALFERFSSRGEGAYGNKVLSAMRFAFGGHKEDQEKE
jgi:6-phosphogluconate dehydrogenase